MSTREGEAPAMTNAPDNIDGLRSDLGSALTLIDVKRPY